MPPLIRSYPLPVLDEHPPTVWRSLSQRRAGGPPWTPEFRQGAEQSPRGVARRTFLKLLGATLAGGGLTGCFREPDEPILPYSRAQPELTPGIPRHYATGFPLAGATAGVVVTSREGRPIKVEGNDLQPRARGSSAVLQASLISLYDPDRAPVVLHQGKATSREEVIGALQEGARRADGGAGLRFLVEPSDSPLLKSSYQRILSRYPRARVVPFCCGEDASLRGAELALGGPLRVQPHYRRVKVAVFLEADPLGDPIEAIAHGQDIAGGRQPGRMSRFYVAECAPTLTGAFADHRLRVRPSQVTSLALALAHEVGARLEHAGLQQVRVPGPLTSFERAFIQGAAADLVAARGDGLLVVGSRQPPALHALALWLNEALGNTGRTLTLHTPWQAPLEDGGQTASLVEELRRGEIDTLVVTAWNPVYRAPGEWRLAELVGRVPRCIYRSLHQDETSRHCGWFAPAAHPYESWGDGRGLDGTVTLIQPLMAPLVEGAFAELDLLAPFLGGEPRTPYEHLRASWRATAGESGDFEALWRRWLGDGVMPGSAPPAVTAAVSGERVAAALAASTWAPETGSLELNLVLDSRVGDGRFANNPWLQELPDPITQLTWRNAALISPRTAAQLQVETGQRLALTLSGATVEAPALVQPGHADGAVTLALGYGRDGTESVAREVGTSAIPLRTAARPWGGPGLTVSRVPGRTALALAQEHWTMEGRSLALQFPEALFDRRPDALQYLREAEPALYPTPDEAAGHRWGMGIDLQRCIGCSACVIACQAENNIPTVGEEGVRQSREMHWLRIDRYFLGDEDNPGIITQPVMCVHCEYAPCEYVCPVNATVHSSEGLNEMVYNRCVGTRYCSNNCPYKVRRFNFFNWNANVQPVERLRMNPDVTVRERGVMEKCTYCVQRIEQARIAAHSAGGEIGEGAVRTACQQACPTQAIVFGDLNRPESQVSRLHADPRAYELLHERGTRPRTRHLVRLKNPREGLS